MRIVFMGTPDFAVPALRALVEGGYEVIGAVTQPDKPKGRGKEMSMPPVKEAAIQYNIPVYQPVKVREKEFVQTLRELAPEAIVVAAFGQILTKDILELPKYGCINIHASLLPKYRGAAPIQWAIINGERETGITTMMMDVGLDTGDMLEKTVIPIEEGETGQSLHDKLSAAGGPLILSTLQKVREGTIVPQPQKDEESCYAKMLHKDLGRIDWEKDAAGIERLIRGLNPWPSAYTGLNGKTLKLWQAKALPEEYAGKAGQVVKADAGGLLVKTGKGTLKVESLQLEGKKRMAADAFLRGCAVEEGTILGI